jgi:hypothetical protein
MSIIYKEEPIWVGLVVLAWDFGVYFSQCFRFQFSSVPKKKSNIQRGCKMRCFLGFSIFFFCLCLVGLILTFNSLLCVYVQSESWECHLSSRKQLNPNPRRSLRYSRRLLEMGATSQPKISTGHSSTSDDIQILNVPATTVNSV